MGSFEATMVTMIREKWDGCRGESQSLGEDIFRSSSTESTTRTLRSRAESFLYITDIIHFVNLCVGSFLILVASTVYADCPRETVIVSLVLGATMLVGTVFGLLPRDCLPRAYSIFICAVSALLLFNFYLCSMIFIAVGGDAFLHFVQDNERALLIPLTVESKIQGFCIFLVVYIFLCMGAFAEALRCWVMLQFREYIIERDTISPTAGRNGLQDPLVSHLSDDSSDDSSSRYISETDSETTDDDSSEMNQQPSEMLLGDRMNEKHTNEDDLDTYVFRGTRYFHW